MKAKKIPIYEGRPVCCAQVADNTARWRMSTARHQKKKNPLSKITECGRVASYQINDKSFCKLHARAIALDIILEKQNDEG